MTQEEREEYDKIQKYEEEKRNKILAAQDKRLYEMVELTRKIKHCIDEGTMSFFIEDGELVALGHFPAGDDTIGKSPGSMISWEMFMEQDF